MYKAVLQLFCDFDLENVLRIVLLLLPLAMIEHSNQNSLSYFK